eukprot:719975-Pelagomonas_calceolata.AAC.2
MQMSLGLPTVLGQIDAHASMLTLPFMNHVSVFRGVQVIMYAFLGEQMFFGEQGKLAKADVKQHRYVMVGFPLRDGMLGHAHAVAKHWQAQGSGGPE